MRTTLTCRVGRGFKPSSCDDKKVENCGWAKPETRFCAYAREVLPTDRHCLYCEGFVKRAALLRVITADSKEDSDATV